MRGRTRGILRKPGAANAQSVAPGILIALPNLGPPQFALCTLGKLRRLFGPADGPFRAISTDCPPRASAISYHSTKWLTHIARSFTFNYMVEREIYDLDGVFRALGDKTRRQIISELAKGERTVSQLAAPFDMSLAAASKHIKVLENAGLIRREKRWREHVCSLEPGPLATADEWLSFYREFWTTRLDTLETLLRSEDVDHSQNKDDTK